MRIFCQIILFLSFISIMLFGFNVRIAHSAPDLEVTKDLTRLKEGQKNIDACIQDLQKETKSINKNLLLLSKDITKSINDLRHYAAQLPTINKSFQNGIDKIWDRAIPAFTVIFILVFGYLYKTQSDIRDAQIKVNTDLSNLKEGNIKDIKNNVAFLMEKIWNMRPVSNGLNDALQSTVSSVADGNI